VSKKENGKGIAIGQAGQQSTIHSTAFSESNTTSAHARAVPVAVQQLDLKYKPGFLEKTYKKP